MMAWGPMEILMLMALGGGGQTADLASCLPADIYFRARNIPITAENMVQLASKKPDDGKAQIAQLLALRVLAEQPELVKKAANSAEITATIEKIAKGELAKDRLGFAEDYAARTLAAVGGPRIRSEPIKQLDMRVQTLGWFPESVTLVGAFDARDRTAGPEEGKAARTLIAKFTKEKDWEKIFEVAEMVGNVRLERISFAYAEGKEAKDPGRLYVRIGGKADHQRVVEAVKKLSPGFPVQQTKDAKAVPLATMAPAE